MMLIGYDQDVPGVVRPPAECDAGSDMVILINQIRLLDLVVLVLDTLHQQAEWTDIVLRCVVVQDDRYLPFLEQYLYVQTLRR
jgi:hypothetical protein